MLERAEVAFELVRILVCQESSALQKVCHLGRLGEDPADHVLALSWGEAAWPACCEDSALDDSPRPSSLAHDVLRKLGCPRCVGRLEFQLENEGVVLGADHFFVVGPHEVEHLEVVGHWLLGLAPLLEGVVVVHDDDLCGRCNL